MSNFCSTTIFSYQLSALEFVALKMYSNVCKKTMALNVRHLPEDARRVKIPHYLHRTLEMQRHNGCGIDHNHDGDEENEESVYDVLLKCKCFEWDSFELCFMHFTRCWRLSRCIAEKWWWWTMNCNRTLSTGRSTQVICKNHNDRWPDDFVHECWMHGKIWVWKWQGGQSMNVALYNWQQMKSDGKNIK